MMDSDYEDMKAYLRLQSKDVQANVSIVSPDMMGAEHALHIDKNIPRVFTPRVPKTGMAKENDSCARVTVASTLLGCYIGYFRGEGDLLEGTKPDEGDTDRFRGGYEISKLAFKHALKPSTVLVPDAERSEELWLVTYSNSTLEYVPVPIGKVFVSEIKYLPVSGAVPTLQVTLYIENTDTLGLPLNRKIKLPVGQFKVVAEWLSDTKRSISDERVTVTKVEDTEYVAAKSRVAAFLSRRADSAGKNPNYLSW